MYVVKEEPAEEGQMNMCGLGKPNCGLLNDNISLMWGEVKDSVDKLDALMAIGSLRSARGGARAERRC